MLQAIMQRLTQQKNRLDKQCDLMFQAQFYKNEAVPFDPITYAAMCGYRDGINHALAELEDAQDKAIP